MTGWNVSHWREVNETLPDTVNLEHASYSVYMYKFNSDWIGQGHCFKTATMVSVKGTKGQETMEQYNNSITILLYYSQRRIS